MRGRILVPAVAALAFAVPATAASAKQLTVDAGAAEGCNASFVCKTITDAVNANNVDPGDEIVIKDGSYTEPGTINLTTPNVTVRAEHTLKVTVTQNSAPVGPTSGPAVFSIVEGDHLDGMIINSPTDGGAAVYVKGVNTTVSFCLMSKTGISTRDTPVYQVDESVGAIGVPGGGVNLVQNSSVISAPTAAAAQTSAALSGSAASTMSIDATIVFSGQQQGPAVYLPGNDITDDGKPVPNRIRTSVLGAVNPTQPALRVTSSSPSFTPKATQIDSTILNGGINGAGILAESFTNGPGQDNSGDIAITAVHATVAGAKFPFVVDAKSSGSTAAKGSISMTFDRSIVHGPSQGTVSTAPGNGGILGIIGTTVANDALVRIQQSDTTQTAASRVTLSATTNTPDDQLFVDPTKLNFHLLATAPVIDKGGQVGAGESVLDVDGEARVNGTASDLGADEFANHPPKLTAATIQPQVAKQFQTVSYGVLAANDPDGGPLTYVWNFGDGSPLVTTTTPYTTHQFLLLGNYFGSVTAVDRQGAASAAYQLPLLRITDGVPPTVKITAPKSKASITLYTTSKSKTGKTVKKLKTIKFTGTAIDESGVANADLSLRRLALKGKKATTSCITTDGKKPFKTTSCKNPQFFRVKFANGGFSYTLKKGQNLKPGSYQLSARATDKQGNTSTPVVVKFTLK